MDKTGNKIDLFPPSLLRTKAPEGDKMHLKSSV